MDATDSRLERAWRRAAALALGTLLCALAAAGVLTATSAVAATEESGAAFADGDALLRHCADVARSGGARGERLAALAELWRSVHPRAELREAARGCAARLERTAAGTAVADRHEATLARLERDFERRLTERSPRLRFTAAEAAGLPSGLLDELRDAGGATVSIGVGLGDYYVFMRHVDSAAARRRMYLAHANRGGAENIATLARIVDTRRQAAAAAGHADAYERTAAALGLPTGAQVETFLAAVGPSIAAAAQQDIDTLRRHKQQHAPKDGRLRRWDALYYIERERQRSVGLAEDDDAARIPTAALRPWLQRYFGALAGLRFEPAPGRGWHAEVDCLQVLDPAAADAALGLLCLDLHPREGKYYNHASFAVPPVPGEPGAHLAALVANLDRDALTPDEVERLFAEFSIALGLLTMDRGRGAAGAAPAQPLWQQLQRAFFEQVAFSDEALALLPEGVAPAPALRAQVRANRSFAAGITASRQLTVARYDLALARATRPVDPMALWRRLEDASGLPYEPGSHYPSRLNALAGANAGLYWSTLWREAAAIDLVQRFGDRTLQPDAAVALRGAFFAAAPPAELMARYRALAGRDLSLDGYRVQIGGNTMAAAARRATLARAPTKGAP
ncbi:M3 family metallopeptidase [Aquabacterium humicola]|uniref:M3 family metallopeptidase n=1 Tax=Aquabacterium humicola TaxID=3237377 RepID=UPI0025434300|nr:M3 family metallopeptidase [Rubrivivax pictus]